MWKHEACSRNPTPGPAKWPLADNGFLPLISNGFCTKLFLPRRKKPGINRGFFRLGRNQTTLVVLRYKVFTGCFLQCSEECMRTVVIDTQSYQEHFFRNFFIESRTGLVSEIVVFFRAQLQEPESTKQGNNAHIKQVASHCSNWLFQFDPSCIITYMYKSMNMLLQTVAIATSSIGSALRRWQDQTPPAGAPTGSARVDESWTTWRHHH